jgi:hypothetical protein
MNGIVGKAAVVVAGFVALITPGSALAAQRYATPTGSGGTCSAVSPCSLVTAANSASFGDEVIVAGNQGSYGTPGTPIATNIHPPASINLHGAAGQPMPVIYSSATPYAITFNSGGTLSYLDVEQLNPGQSGVITGAPTDHLIARGGLAGCALFTGITLSDSLCTGSTAGIYTNESSSGTQTLTLRNVTAEGGASGNGISITVGSYTVTVTASNVIARGGSHDVVAAQFSGALTINLDHSNYAVISAGAGTTITAAGTATNQTAAPLFADAAGGDFHQVPGSPTIDAGVDSAANGTSDFDGDPRTVHGATDIGADEFLPQPDVATGAASSLTLTTAVIGGTVNPNAQATTYHFEYGRTAAYGQSTPSQTLTAGQIAQPVSAALAGLSPATLYHYRLVATNATGTSAGADATFTTIADPFAGVLFASRSAVVKKGVARVKLKCPASTPGRCVGNLSLTRKRRAARHPKARSKTRTVSLGRSTFSIRAGRTVGVKVKLSKRGRKLLAKARKLAVVATSVAHDEVGVTKRTKAKVKLKLSQEEPALR